MVERLRCWAELQRSVGKCGRFTMMPAGGAVFRPMRGVPRSRSNLEVEEGVICEADI